VSERAGANLFHERRDAIAECVIDGASIAS
jgi:hypothetical protein